MKKWHSEKANWEYHLGQVRIDKNLTLAQKEKTLAGICKIREIFGEDWLKKAARTKHPIFYNLCNEDHWARFWLADFGVNLAELQNVQNFDELKRKLMDQKSFHDYEAEMEVAAKLKKSGLSIKFLKVRSHKKTPDLEIESGVHKIYVEVRNMRTPESMELASITLRALAALSSCAESKYNVKIALKAHKTLVKKGKAQKILPTPHIQELRDKIFSGAEKATKEKLCVERSKPEIFECLIVPREKFDYLKEWRKRKGMARTWEGPLPNVDEVERVASRLIKEYCQLPKNEPGLIVICQNNLTYGWDIDFPSYINLNSYQKIVRELKGKFHKKYSNLIAAILIISYYFGRHQPNKTIEDKNYFLTMKHSHGIQKDTLIIKNRYCKLPFPEKVLDAFK